MCSVFGWIAGTGSGEVDKIALQSRRQRVYGSMDWSTARGADAWGLATFGHDGWPHMATRDFGRFRSRMFREHSPDLAAGMLDSRAGSAIGVLRAEPTTEWRAERALADLQPFTVGGWTVAHNGTIANDRDLLKRARALLRLASPSPERAPPTDVDSYSLAAILSALMEATPESTAVQAFSRVMRSGWVVGSYALLAVHVSMPRTILFATNYKPLYVARHQPSGDVFLVSSPEFLLGRDPSFSYGQISSVWSEWSVREVPPYSIGRIAGHDELPPPETALIIHPLMDHGVVHAARPKRVLVVCSGGLDSTVVATMMQNIGHEVALLHFDYGCRAGEREANAVGKIAAALGVERVMTVPLGDLFRTIIPGGPLTEAGSTISTGRGGVDGAEFAHEWVPARNLIMLSLATGIAEANGFDVLALGTNLEESGAYPDNEPEFIRRFAAVLPYAVGPGASVKLATPVGTMMKHDIVTAGLSAKAPLHLTWSCYEGGDLHCGACGPCFMRRTAFRMAGETDPVNYANG